jgi:hypothetical protein
MLPLLLLLLPLTTTARNLCVYNCTCSDDSSCEFYCSNGQCQYSIPLFQQCSGYQIHPRECGTFQWCNPLTKQCERAKSVYYNCQYNYECISGYCSVKTGDCRQRPDPPIGTIIPSVIAGTLFLVIIIIIIIYQKRIATLKKHSINASTNNPNVCSNAETKPPPYGFTPRH